MGVTRSNPSRYHLARRNSSAGPWYTVSALRKNKGIITYKDGWIGLKSTPMTYSLLESLPTRHFGVFSLLQPLDEGRLASRQVSVKRGALGNLSLHTVLNGPDSGARSSVQNPFCAVDRLRRHSKLTPHRQQPKIVGEVYRPVRLAS